MVFQAVVLSTLFYACETWTLYRRDKKWLESFQQRKLRQILGAKWEDCISNDEILKRVSLPSVEATILKHRLHWSGHILRIDSTRLPKIMLCGELDRGKGSKGSPKLRYKDQFKLSLNQANIDQQSWEQLATDRAAWRKRIIDGTTSFESKRRQLNEEKRKRKHERLNLPRPSPSIPCDFCTRYIHQRLGLSSHIRHKHRRQPGR